MQKILLAIIASAVAVTMLSSFGTLPALANPSPGVPGSGMTPPPGQNPAKSGGAHPGANTVACDETGLTNTPGNSGTSGGAHTSGHIYAGTGAGNSNPPGQPGGAQYDVSCFQQQQH